jgi:3'-5' exoribonuclease
MKTPFISELAPNQLVNTTFLVHHKDIRQKKTGEPYLSLTFADRSGELDAKMWDNVAEVMETFDRDDFVRVKGLVQLFQNRLQLTVHKVQRIDDSEVDVVDYFPASKRNPDEMFAELQALIARFENPHLKALVEAVFADPDIAHRFRQAPAAKAIHHAYLGGLLEHVLSMCTVARQLGAHYTDIDVDLLVTGVLLHDIGKIYELNYQRTFTYSTEGQLLGHILMGVRIVGDKLAAIPGFPPRLRVLVEHLILSHHGQLEFGSPKVPLFPEALLLHFIDNLDSKMEAMRATLERDAGMEGDLTSYNNALDRSVLKKGRFLDPAPPTSPEQKPAPAGNHKPPPAPRSQNMSLFGERLTQALGKE